MSKRPMEIWVHGNRVYESVHSVYSYNRDGTNVVFAKDSPECIKYHHDSKYRALEAENERFRDALDTIREECLCKVENSCKWVRQFCGEFAKEALKAEGE